MEKIKVLVVDDSSLIRESLKLFLSSSIKIKIVADCSDGDEVLESLSSKRIDVIVMDFNMQRMDGDEAIRLVRKHYPHIIVIGHSFAPDDIVRKIMIEAGAVEVLDKVSGFSILEESIVNNY